MIKKSDIKSLLKRSVPFRSSDGRFNSLGSTAEERIRKILFDISILDLLCVIHGLSKIPELRSSGFAVGKDKQVTLSLNAFLVLGSISLSLFSKKSDKIKWQNSLKSKKAELRILQASLCYNDETDVGESNSQNKNNAILNHLTPTKYNQSKFQTPEIIQLCRIYSWYCKIPKKELLKPPTKLNDFVRSEYGFNLSELPHSLFLLWA